MNCRKMSKVTSCTFHAKHAMVCHRHRNPLENCRLLELPLQHFFLWQGVSGLWNLYDFYPDCAEHSFFALCQLHQAIELFELFGFETRRFLNYHEGQGEIAAFVPIKGSV